MNVARRTAFVPADRLPGWVARFSGAHGGLTATEDTDDGVMLRMHDGSVALLSPPWPDDGRPGRGRDVVERLTSLALQERRLGIVLVRRGGYAVGIAVGGKLLAHKVGTASARSRGGDPGAAVVEKAVTEAGKVFSGQNFEYLATGGDTKLLAAVLSTPAMRPVAGRPQLAPLAVSDPNMAVLQKAAADFCSLRIQITDP
ncbi:Vms1/Ankzf1 family peptidyl-tRNA hydrolase [Arthrobacter sp. TWP1-1]|uniref:Vms1/Ankzf1 family peptidyl-tRNA hydrolase n=1 Tax=Arthrobacter sp. TWP1-1 TaxID=2804568 RepID=UPI003CF098CC